MGLTRAKVQNIDFDVTNITDPLIRINSGETGSADKDAGIVIERGDDTNVAILYDESANEFAVVNTSETGTTAGNVTISSYANIKADEFHGDGSNLTGIGSSYTHPNHSGDVVSSGDGALTIQTDAVDIAMLSASGTASSSTFLRGDNSWATAAGTLDGLTDCTVSASTPTATSNPSAVGHLWIEEDRGLAYICTDATTNANVWRGVGIESLSTVEYLVVAGGGGGGGNNGTGNAGGGGAGGYRTSTSFAITTGSSYTVTVGAGGGGAATNVGSNGANSVFGSITSTGGGGGGAYSNQAGLAGGSGGGGPQTNGSGGAGTSGQGNAGGDNGGIGGSGGGGAGGTGYSSTGSSNREGGVGGIGLASSITGSSVYRAGGGGGGTHNTGTGGYGVSGAGGQGGGGHGHYKNTNQSEAGGANQGGGGGGGGETSHAGANGGSGVVIIAYSTDYSAATTSGTVSVSTASRSGYRVYTFTGSGTITF